MEQRPADRESTARRLALWSVFAGATLAALKVVIGLAADSTAVVSDGFEGVADVFSSGIVFAGLWLASRPPDDNHPYGHGRYEILASLGVGGILVCTGALICVRGFLTMSRPESIQAFAMYPLLASVVVKVILGSMKWQSARRLGSSSLAADAWHDMTDLFSTLVAITAVAISLLNPARFHKADHVGSIVIGLIVVFVGIRLARQTVELLTDAMPDARSMNEIREVAMSVPGAAGIEKCFARRTGFRYHVDLHLEVDPELTVRESHDIAYQVKTQVKEKLDWVADVLVHVEPSPGAGLNYGAKPPRASGLRR